MKKILLVLGVALIAPQLATAESLEAIWPDDARLSEKHQTHLPTSIELGAGDRSKKFFTSRTISGELTQRFKNGKLVTSQGVIQLTAAVSIEDKRPISEWYKNPTKAKISMLYRDNSLLRVVIYP
jgi:hypothetical protein